MPMDRLGRLLCPDCGKPQMRFETRDRQGQRVVVFSCIRCTESELTFVPMAERPRGYRQPQLLS